METLADLMRVKPMTQAQIRKLETILAKLETLQNDVRNRSIVEGMTKAKRILLDVLTEGETGHRPHSHQ